MNQRFTELRLRTQKAKEAAQQTERDLDNAVRSCRHDFDKPRYDPIVTPAGHSEGDPPGTMGVDWRGPVYWPREEKPQWSRTCKTCGHVEYTQRTSEVPSDRIPKF